MNTTCDICGKETQHHAAKLCDSCWELDTRIRIDFNIAKKIIKIIDNEIDEAIKKEKK
jgi:hypothetical protein